MANIFTIETVDTLTPAAVADIFELYARGNSIKETLRLIKERHPTLKIAESGLRKVLHVQAPFNSIGGLYDNTLATTRAGVEARFLRAGRKRRGSGKKSKPSPDVLSQRTTILSTALEAKLAYDDAVSKCQSVGLSQKAVEAWFDLVQHGDLER